jgi:hypothetical protein
MANDIVAISLLLEIAEITLCTPTGHHVQSMQLAYLHRATQQRINQSEINESSMPSGAGSWQLAIRSNA